MGDKPIQALDAKLTKLALETKSHPPSTTAESWEDEDEDDESALSGANTPRGQTRNSTLVPPPTPSSPTAREARQASEFSFVSPYAVKDTASTASGASHAGLAGSRRDKPLRSLDERPEKQVGTASRLIAGALGVRAPKKTDEMKAYEKSEREAVRKKREKERERVKGEEEERQRAIKAVWDD